MSRLYMMVSVINRDMKDRFRDFYERNGQTVAFAMLGRGTASSAVLDYFGLEKTEKIIYFSIVTGENWKKLRRGLIVEMKIDVPGTGIAFIIPLGSVGGKNVLHFLIQDQSFKKEEETLLKGTEFELIIAISNQGYIDSVMEAARSANAGGGTVIHAKGTGMEKAQKFLGVSLAEEKEVILIVSKASEKRKIMKAIMAQAGLSSKEKAIVFSLPVTNVAGFRLIEDEIDE